MSSSELGTNRSSSFDLQNTVGAPKVELREHREFYINGQWVQPHQPKDFPVINPATEEMFAVISLGTSLDVDRAVAAAAKAFETYSESTQLYRLELLKNIAAVYRSKMDQMASTISLEMGAPISLSRSAQTPSGLAHFTEMIRVLEDFTPECRPGPTLMRKEPIGVCGLITPWNWPINQIACKVAPALAAGCTVVLKPSELAPLSAYLFAQILHEAGVPAGVFNLVNGEGPIVGYAISSHPDVAMVSFTGSTKAGISVATSAAPTVKRVTQELGGKSANIILDDADLELAVREGVRACFRNTGQSCNAPTRMLVSRKQMPQAIAFAKHEAESTRVGDPSDPDTVVGPLSSKAQYEKVQFMIQQGINEGASSVSGGLGRPPGLGRGYYVKPTVFADVHNQMRIAREEVFGPVLCLIEYADEEDAVRIANDTVYGLSGYVSSGDIQRARRIARRLRVGNVHINYARLDFRACFGGYKQSGNGREWSSSGFEEFFELKAILGYEQ